MPSNRLLQRPRHQAPSMYGRQGFAVRQQGPFNNRGPFRFVGPILSSVSVPTEIGPPSSLNVGTHVDLVLLQTFAVVADSGTQRRASERLHITPQAVGAQVKKLEQELGVVLFERGRGGSRLTSAGGEILEHARRILKSSTRLIEFAEGVTLGDAGSLSIACYPVHVERMLGSVLGKFHAKLPQVRIDLSQMRDDRRRGWGTSLFEELRDGQVDVAIGPKHDGPEYGLTGCQLYIARIVALVPENHAFRHSGSIPVAELAQQPLLIAPDGFFSRQRVSQAAREAGFELTVAFQSSNPPALLALGSHGLGIPVIADDYPLVGQQRFPYPVVSDVRGDPIQTEVWMHWRESAPRTPALDALIAITKDLVDDERRLGKKYQEYYRSEMVGRERREELVEEGAPNG